VWDRLVDFEAMKWLQQNSPGLQAWGWQSKKTFALKGRPILGPFGSFVPTTTSDALSGRDLYVAQTQA
jgi:hypothetical protein